MIDKRTIAGQPRRHLAQIQVGAICELKRVPDGILLQAAPQWWFGSIKMNKRAVFQTSGLKLHAHLCYWKETLTCWAVALAGTGWLETLSHIRKKLPVADTFNIWKVERQNSLMCRDWSQRVCLGTEHSPSTCCFYFISFRFLNIHDLETSGKQCHHQMKLFLEWHEWGIFYLFVLPFPIVHNVKVAMAHHTFERMWCKGSHSHLIFGPSLQMLPQMRGLRGRSQHMACQSLTGAHSMSTLLLADVLV